METPEKTITLIETTPVSKRKVENSLLFNYIDSLSPIKPIPIGSQTLSSLCFSSPPSVFTSPHVASHKESRFRSLNNDSISNKENGDEEEALIEIEHSTPTTTTPRVISDDSCAEDLQKMCEDNVKSKSETPDWGTYIPDDEVLIYGAEPPNDSEAFRYLMPKTSNSEYESLDTLSTLHRGVRRRCLDFDMSGNNNQTLSVVPRIGLHLNAIALSSKDNNIGNNYSFSGNDKVGTTPVVLNFNDTARENETEKDTTQGVEEGPLVQVDQSSPKKKKRKSEQVGEGVTETSCKRCKCIKSKCLKLYCECFAAGVYCIEPCSCVDCFNKPIHEDTVLATRKHIETRNPLAFAPKVIRNSDSNVEASDDASKTPASARHKRGCNCKKSNCNKKYCECYQSGVGCSINCRCEGCKNSFGRKHGQSSFVGEDIENETQQEKIESTPLPIRQPLAQLPISSNNILHGASRFFSNRKQDLSLLHHSRIERITEERAEDIENQSPMTNINAVSPNSKRVSLPRLHSSESTPWRSVGDRKLPTFPPLTPNSLNL